MSPEGEEFVSIRTWREVVAAEDGGIEMAGGISYRGELTVDKVE